VQLWVKVRRFHCRHASCRRKIFCERLPQVARAYGRQTERASEIIRLIGYVAGGLPAGLVQESKRNREGARGKSPYSRSGR
jgi:hypothetical protein